jgi:NADH dehydrogenase (ubiquinone) Fe-S protein 1
MEWSNYTMENRLHICKTFEILRIL